MKTVVCFGASLTAGTVSFDYVEQLNSRSDLAGFRFVNHGVNGDLAWDGLQRLDRVIAEEPDFVTILIGTNDVNATLSERNRLRYVTFNHLPLERPDVVWYEKNLRSIVEKLRHETHARLALLSLAMIGEDLGHEANRQVDRYNEVIRRLAAEEDVTYLPLHECLIGYLQAQPVKEDRPPRLAYRDGLINVGNALALHATGLSWDEISRRNGLLLTTDCLHLNSIGGGMIADLIGDWLAGADALGGDA